MKRVIIWGMGKYYKERKHWLKNVEIIAFVNDSEDNNIDYFEGVRVIKSKEINNFQFDELILAVYEINNILPNLLSCGVIKDKIVTLAYKKNLSCLDEDRKKVKTAYGLWANLGDAINSYMMDNLFNVDIVGDSNLTAELVAIGSRLDYFLKKPRYNYATLEVMKKVNITYDKIDVWGTGFGREYMGGEFIRPVNISALRGEYSKKVMERILKRKINCVLGDPGLLISCIYNDEVEKKYDVGIIPHVYDQSRFNVENIDIKKNYKKSILIDVTKEPCEVIHEMRQCECILSTCLHGLIIADSFGIPNKWCAVRDYDKFKWLDYYSALGISEERLNLNEEFPDLDNIIKNYKVDRKIVNKIQDELMACFPYR